MPSYNVHINLDELFEEVGDDDLMEEVRERGLIGNYDKREVIHLLKNCAQFLRDKNNPAMALGIDDLISDLGLL